MRSEMMQAGTSHDIYHNILRSFYLVLSANNGKNIYWNMYFIVVFGSILQI